MKSKTKGLEPRSVHTLVPDRRSVNRAVVRNYLLERKVSGKSKMLFEADITDAFKHVQVAAHRANFFWYVVHDLIAYLKLPLPDGITRAPRRKG